MKAFVGKTFQHEEPFLNGQIVKKPMLCTKQRRETRVYLVDADKDETTGIWKGFSGGHWFHIDDDKRWRRTGDIGFVYVHDHPIHKVQFGVGMPHLRKRLREKGI